MSVVWLSVFVLLCVELIVTAVLVLPLPRLVRKSIASAIFRFELAKRVRFFIRFTILACLFAIWDCVQVRLVFAGVRLGGFGAAPLCGRSRGGWFCGLLWTLCHFVDRNLACGSHTQMLQLLTSLCFFWLSCLYGRSPMTLSPSCPLRLWSPYPPYPFHPTGADPAERKV